MRAARLLRVLAAFLLAVAGNGCRTRKPAESRFEFPGTQMGMPWRLVLYADSRTHAESAADAAWKRVAELNSRLSDYEPGSELSRLSKASGSGADIPLSPDLERVLRKAEEVSRAGDGAFDITVGPLVDVWKRARRQRQLPDPGRIAAARAACGWTNVVLSRDARGQATARLLRPGMRLDPGGIAKGYAIGEASRVLREHGIRNSLVTAGGDLFASGSPPGQDGWIVAVGEPDLTNAPPARRVRLRDLALVTSGDLFQRVEIEGVRYSHIVDPRTGQALTDHSQVTLVGRDPMTLDALSKVLSVQGPPQADRLARRFGFDALLFRAPQGRLETHATPGWRRRETALESGVPADLK